MKKSFFILSLLFIICLTACKKEEPKPSEEEMIALFKKQFREFYTAYSKSDDRYLDYYEEDIVRIDTEGNADVGKDVFIKKWGENQVKYTIKVLFFSEPNVIYSHDQIVSYSTFDELFILNETQDTTNVKGTWIGVWKKQPDNSWKVKMSTWHVK
ncbi:hypothetical protein [Leptobacterium sp. I13]|uniref:YybH family protein n=1 Tax=Leptobacterium meishanense TaxID=3128904 RepID=UPI0030EEF271